MNLYWFSDEEGGYWAVIAAKDDEQAWRLLAESQVADSGGPDARMTLGDARTSFVLNARTEIDGNTEGKVASIFPREVNFTIRETPGGELSALTNH